MYINTCSYVGGGRFNTLCSWSDFIFIYLILRMHFKVKYEHQTLCFDPYLFCFRKIAFFSDLITNMLPSRIKWDK